MIKLFSLTVLALMFCNAIRAQVAINAGGTGADSSAMLEVKSADKGFLPPRMSQAEMEGIANPAPGLCVYNTDLNTICYFNGTTWDCLDAPSIFDKTFLCGNNLNDLRDSTIYKTVQIGSQCWMAENLNIGKMINGSSDQTDNDTIEKYCYGDSPANCNIYGGLYQWNEMMQYATTEGTQGICPTGWHTPTDAEWCILENYVDSGTVSCSATGWRGTDAGGNLKETGTTHWLSPNAGATNSSGFTVLPTGRREPDLSFDDLSLNSHIWSSSESGSNAFRRFFSFNYAEVSRGYDPHGYGFSVRCLKDYVLSSYSIGSGGSCDNTIVNGDYHGGIPLDTSNTVTLDVEVTTTGAWSITTNTVNGYSFSGSGTFNAIGTVQVILYGIGTPTASQTDSFTATANDSGGTCTFNVAVFNTVYNPATGEIWMDRNLGATQVATSSTDTAAYGDLYQWGRYTEGHEVRTSATTSMIATTAVPNDGNPWDGLFITKEGSPFDWLTPQDNTLWQGASGTNNPCPAGFRLPSEAEWEAERLSWSSNNAAGAFSSHLKLTTGGFRANDNGRLQSVGSEGYYWSSSISGTNARSLYFLGSDAYVNSYGRAFGYSVRCIKDNATYSIGSGGSCANTTINGSYIAGVALDTSNTVTLDATVTMTGPWSIRTDTLNGYSFSGSGIFNTTGTLQVTLHGTGTPINCQTDSFTTTASGTVDTCTFNVSVVGTVYNPTTGEIWMDRNLGASQVATSSSDATSYGDLYQWGRYTEGHEDRTSGTTSTTATTAVPDDGNTWDGLFILPSSSPWDWISPQDNTLWQGEVGTNNPCPSGFRIPTEAEWEAERLSWSSNDAAGAFGSPLKLPAGGFRNYDNGALHYVGSYGYYWSSTVSGIAARILHFTDSDAEMNSHNRAHGFSVRCIMDD